MKKEIPVVHKSQAEIEEDAGITWEEFKAKKEYDENSPLQFTNKIVTPMLARGSGYPAKAYMGTAVTLYAECYPEYRRHLELAGYKYAGKGEAVLPPLEEKEDYMKRLCDLGIRLHNYPGDIKAEGGFSLVEALVVCALMAVFAMGIVKIDKGIDESNGHNIQRIKYLT